MIPQMADCGVDDRMEKVFNNTGAKATVELNHLNKIQWIMKDLLSTG